MAGEPSSWLTSANAAARASSLVTSTLSPRVFARRRQGRGAAGDVGRRVQQRDVDTHQPGPAPASGSRYLWLRR